MLSCDSLHVVYLHVVASVFGVRNDPVVDGVGPISTSFDLHVLLSRNELVDDQVLQPNLTSQLSDTLHQVFSLVVNNVSDIVELALGLLVLGPHFVNVLILLLKLLLLGRELLSQVDLHFLLRGNFLLEHELLSTAIFKFSLRLEKLLLLLHCLVHGFVSLKELLLHVLDSLQQLLLLGLLLLVVLLLGIKLFQQAGSLLLSDLSLRANHRSLLLKLLPDLLLFLLELLFQLLHLLFILNMDVLLHLEQLLARSTRSLIKVDLSTGELF